MHAVRCVESPRLVHQQRPLKTGLADISLGNRAELEGHDRDVDVRLLQLLFVLPQLRQMLPAGQSAKMPVKNKQEPIPVILLQAMNNAIGIWQFERRGRLADIGGRTHDQAREDKIRGVVRQCCAVCARLSRTGLYPL